METEETKVYLYWYKEYWLHRLYREGIESAVRLYGGRLPCRYEDDEGRKEKGNTRLFFWKLILMCGEGERCLPTVDILGYRLYGLLEKKGDHCAVVELKKENGSDVLRLYASKNYKVGDAVIFLSEFEEKTGCCILGGAYARTERNESMTNVCMTYNRMLRCTKEIGKGEEIVRWLAGCSAFYNDIDRVVLSADTMIAGRVGTESIKNGTERLVHFADGSYEVLRERRHLKVDYYR